MLSTGTKRALEEDVLSEADDMEESEPMDMITAVVSHLFVRHSRVASSYPTASFRAIGGRRFGTRRDATEMKPPLVHADSHIHTPMSLSSSTITACVLGTKKALRVNTADQSPWTQTFDGALTQRH